MKDNNITELCCLQPLFASCWTSHGNQCFVFCTVYGTCTSRENNQVNQPYRYEHNGNQANQLCLRLDLQWQHNFVSSYLLETK